MAKAVTETFTLNNDWVNLYEQAVSDGYRGSLIAQSGTVVNFNSTVMYVHMHTSGSTNPTTAADGLPIGTNSSTAPGPAWQIEPGTDLSTIWLHTAGSLSIKYTITGK